MLGWSVGISEGISEGIELGKVDGSNECKLLGVDEGSKEGHAAGELVGCNKRKMTNTLAKQTRNVVTEKCQYSFAEEAFDRQITYCIRIME